MNDQIRSVATLAFMIVLYSAPQLKAAEPTLKEVLAAMRNAEAAGDAQAGQRLAQIARSMQLDTSNNMIRVVENGGSGKQSPSAQNKVKSNLDMYQVTFPDGTVYQIEGPKDATKAEIYLAAKRQIAKEKSDRLKVKMEELEREREEILKAEAAKSATIMGKIRSSTSSLFGSLTPMECHSKYVSSVRLPDANNLLQQACTMGYSDSASDEFRKAGRCIAQKSADLFSIDQSLAVINKCSTDGIVFSYFKRALLIDSTDRKEREEQIRADQQEQIISEQQRLSDALINSRKSNNDFGSMTIYDRSTGTYKRCSKFGNDLTCN
ncbi:MAG: hypothetical protein ACOYL0_15155 [Limnohabitans sp.]